jgi:hypothetical protein
MPPTFKSIRVDVVADVVFVIFIRSGLNAVAPLFHVWLIVSEGWLVVSVPALMVAGCRGFRFVVDCPHATLGSKARIIARSLFTASFALRR